MSESRLVDTPGRGSFSTRPSTRPFTDRFRPFALDPLAHAARPRLTRLVRNLVTRFLLALAGTATVWVWHARIAPHGTAVVDRAFGAGLHETTAYEVSYAVPGLSLAIPWFVWLLYSSGVRNGTWRRGLLGTSIVTVPSVFAMLDPVWPQVSTPADRMTPVLLGGMAAWGISTGLAFVLVVLPVRAESPHGNAAVPGRIRDATRVLYFACLAALGGLLLFGIPFGRT